VALQVTNAALLTDIPIVNEVLGTHAPELGRDFVAYRNHVYRIVNLSLAIVGGSRIELEKLAVAAAFHDLGIWTHHTFDYLQPSMTLARRYLVDRGRAEWITEVEAMIADHHKVTRARADATSLVEAFRRADWIDVSRGLRTFGIERAFIASVFSAWPSSGFHRRLVELAVDRFWRHPLTPLPMLRL
jgi:HD domain